jgi:spore maturation protein CgeB
LNILLAGDWHSMVHEEPAFHGLRGLGHEVGRFAWHGYFRAPEKNLLSRLWRRLQNKYLFGPQLQRLNADLIKQATAAQPSLIFIYRGTHILPATIRALRQCVPGVVIVGYNNDDPLAPDQPRWLWRHFLACLPEYDAALAYRQHNLTEYSQHGARQVYLLRSWFVPEFNHPVRLSEAERARFESDVVFVGHYENDGRLQLLEEVVKSGMRLRLFGPTGWDGPIAQSTWLSSLAPIKPVWGEDYNKALCGAKVALCFFSKLNRDTYTRRCFEIPATGTLMLSEYSIELASLFSEGNEADYFRSGDEMIRKLRYYMNNSKHREQIAAAGMRRVHGGGHDVQSRMRALLDWLTESGILRRATHAS